MNDKKKTTRVVYKIDIEKMSKISLKDNMINVFTDNNITMVFSSEEEAFNEFENILDAVRNEQKYALASTIQEK